MNKILHLIIHDTYLQGILIISITPIILLIGVMTKNGERLLNETVRSVLAGILISAWFYFIVVILMIPAFSNNDTLNNNKK